MPDRPLRILTISDTQGDPNSGASGTVYHTNVALRRLGHEVHEIWAQDLGPRRIRHGNLHSLVEQPYAYRQATVSRVGATHYDVVQFQQPQSYLAAKALRRVHFQGIVLTSSQGVEPRVAREVSKWHKQFGIRRSRRMFGLVTPILQSLLHRQWRNAVRESDGVTVDNAQDHRFLIEEVGADPAQIGILHTGIPAEFSETAVQLLSPDRMRRVLHVGQFAFYKGPHVVAAVFNRLLGHEDRVCATWVCAQQDHRKARSLLDDRVASRVQFVDWMPQADLLPLLDRHGTFLFPSFAEGFGRAALEAMSRGLCVVASASSGMLDYIEDGQNGFLCAPGASDQFADRLSFLMSNDDASASVSCAARDTACRYSWHACACNLLRFSQQICRYKQSVRAIRNG